MSYKPRITSLFYFYPTISDFRFRFLMFHVIYTIVVLDSPRSASHCCCPSKQKFMSLTVCLQFNGISFNSSNSMVVKKY
uniref:Uncharacterized protein n=1 Tax=Arundo donax TaxID=35708 RepID=A0A0A9HKR2_ARUDO